MSMVSFSVMILITVLVFTLLFAHTFFCFAWVSTLNTGNFCVITKALVLGSSFADAEAFLPMSKVKFMDSSAAASMHFSLSAAADLLLFDPTAVTLFGAFISD